MGRYQPFHDLPASQFQALVTDIEQRGVLLPIIVDEDDKTIDGHQRRRAAAEAGVECPKVVVEGLTEQEKTTLSLTLNLFRRHLSGTERSKALQQLANLGMSTRRMADITGLSKSTVHRSLEEIERPETIVGESGKSYPSKRPVVPHGTTEPPPNVDPETGEIKAPSGSDQSAQPDAAGSGDDEQTHGRAAPSPAPKVASEDAASVAEFVTSGADVQVAQLRKRFADALARTGAAFTFDVDQVAPHLDENDWTLVRHTADQASRWFDHLLSKQPKRLRVMKGGRD